MRSITVDDVESNSERPWRPESTFGFINVHDAIFAEEQRGPDPEWDARMQAKWDAYDATPNGIAFSKWTKYAHHHAPGVAVS